MASASAVAVQSTSDVEGFTNRWYCCSAADAWSAAGRKVTRGPGRRWFEGPAAS
jgi:hypothetical protein